MFYYIKAIEPNPENYTTKQVASMELCGIEDFAASISSISQHESRKSERASGSDE